jgi:hypothetical protein
MALAVLFRRGPVLASAALAIGLVTQAGAATPAASLGAEAPIGKPEGGFVGRIALQPEHGPVGTPVEATLEGLPPGQDLQLTWHTVEGRWKVGDGEYRGREYKPVAYVIATVRASADGRATARFEAPDDFGFWHDVAVQQGARLLTRAAFAIDMTMSLTPENAPQGSLVTVDVKGIGWRPLQNSWTLLYDNNFTGWISSVSTQGSARFTIPATGAPGPHVLEVLHGEFTYPYRNMQQNPEPDRPRFALPLTITSGPTALPPAAPAQLQANVRSLPPQGDLVAAPRFSAIQQPVSVRGTGLTPGKTHALNWTTVTGNRVAGNGFDEHSRVIAQATADATGAAEFRFTVPDDLGGTHGLWIEDAGKRFTGTYWITPSALPLNVDRGPVGTRFTVHLKGVGWTETANIYTVLYDNAYIGYACGFNSQGDVEIFLVATGTPGWHFVDLVPAIYKGQETRPNNFRIPQLTYEQDHPAEDLPRFRFAFEVTE